MLLLSTRHTQTTKKKKKTWSQRMEIEDQKWSEKRTDILDCLKSTYSLSHICQICREEQSILKCTECLKDICSACDLIVHENYPFHNRSSFESGHLEPILPTEYFDSKNTLMNTGRNL